MEEKIKELMNNYFKNNLYSSVYYIPEKDILARQDALEYFPNVDVYEGIKKTINRFEFEIEIKKIQSKNKKLKK